MPEQIAFLRSAYKLFPQDRLTLVFNVYFGTELTVQQIRSATRNHRIRSGRTGRFKKVQKPWNTGTKGLISANRTSFKKGNIPANRKPIGSERDDRGSVLIKIDEPNPYTGFPTQYKRKNIHVWEQAYGPVPDGMVVALKDGDWSNVVPENLMLISRAELLRLNQYRYKDAPDELKPSLLALARLEVKTFAMQKKKK